MRKIAIGALVAIAAAVALADPASSHGGHDENIRLIGTDYATQLRFVVEAEQILWFDSDRDGKLSRAEFDRQADAIADCVDACLNARAKDGAAMLPEWRDQPVAGYADLDESDAVERVRFIRSYAADTTLAKLDFACFPGAHGQRQIITVGLPDPNQISFASGATQSVIR